MKAHDQPQPPVHVCFNEMVIPAVMHAGCLADDTRLEEVLSPVHPFCQQHLEETGHFAGTAVQPGCLDERFADNGQVEQPGGCPHLGCNACSCGLRLSLSGGRRIQVPSSPSGLKKVFIRYWSTGMPLTRRTTSPRMKPKMTRWQVEYFPGVNSACERAMCRVTNRQDSQQGFASTGAGLGCRPGAAGHAGWWQLLCPSARTPASSGQWAHPA